MPMFLKIIFIAADIIGFYFFANPILLVFGGIMVFTMFMD